MTNAQISALVLMFSLGSIGGMLIVIWHIEGKSWALKQSLIGAVHTDPNRAVVLVAAEIGRREGSEP